MGGGNPGHFPIARLKIWNPAVLPEGWTVESLLADHPSTPFNPDIANAFFRAGEIETWGRGIQRLVEACASAGTPTPIIDYKPNDLWIEFPFARDYLKAIATAPGIYPPGSGKTSGKIIALIEADAHITISQLAAAIGVTERSVERSIQTLQK